MRIIEKDELRKYRCNILLFALQIMIYDTL